MCAVSSGRRYTNIRYLRSSLLNGLTIRLDCFDVELCLDYLNVLTRGVRINIVRIRYPDAGFVRCILISFVRLYDHRGEDSETVVREETFGNSHFIERRLLDKRHNRNN